MFLLNFLVFVSWLEDHTYVELNNILSPRRGSPSLGLCIGTTFKKRLKQAQQLCFNVQPSSALHLAVGLSALWLDLPDRRSALHFVFCAYASSFGPLCCCSANRVVVGLTAWLFNRPCGCSTIRMVVRLIPWLFDRPRGCSTVRMVVVFTMWSCGASRRHCTSRSFVEASTSSLGPSRRGS